MNNIEKFNLDHHSIDAYKNRLYDALKDWKIFAKERRLKLFNLHSMSLDGFLLDIDNGRLIP